MRQDALVLQLVKMMNDIWLSEDLDLRMVIFRCIPFGNKSGTLFSLLFLVVKLFVDPLDFLYFSCFL